MTANIARCLFKPGSDSLLLRSRQFAESCENQSTKNSEILKEKLERTGENKKKLGQCERINLLVYL